MTPDLEQLLSAVLADLDGIQRRVERVETAVAEMNDSVEASRVSLGALRGALRMVTS